MWKDCNEYWKQVVVDYMSCFKGEYDNISERDLKIIVNNLLNDDSMWQVIDESVDYWLDQRQVEKNKKKEG